MGFNHTSYRWISQPRQFPGQQLERQYDDQRLDLDDRASLEHSRAAKHDWRELLFSLQTLIQQFHQSLQN